MCKCVHLKAIYHCLDVKSMNVESMLFWYCLIWLANVVTMHFCYCIEIMCKEICDANKIELIVLSNRPPNGFEFKGVIGSKVKEISNQLF